MRFTGFNLRAASRTIVAVATIAAALALPSAALAAPSATTGSATDVDQTSALLNGTVDPDHAPTIWRFQYATDADYPTLGYTNSASWQYLGIQPNNVPAGVPFFLQSTPVAQRIDSLASGTTYHYRLVVQNNWCAVTPLQNSCPVPPVTVYGSDATFTTLP